MSISRTVIVNRTRMPTPTAWADAIRAAGFPMEMTTDFDIAEHSGFLPCTYDGVPAGFELFFTTDEELLEHDDIGDRDAAISFVTHSSMRDLACAIVAAGVLAAKCDGIVFDEESGERIDADEALAYAREMIDSLSEDLD